MKITEFIKNNILILDGGMGTLLQKRGLSEGEAPADWNISHPDIIRDIHRAYYDAGSNIVSTNTFGISTLKYDREQLRKIISAAVDNCVAAKKLSLTEKEKFIAFDIGPTGRLLKPYGDLDFEDAVEIFAENVRIADSLDIDLFFIETMNDSYETKAALLAVKENSNKPVFVSNAYSLDGKLVTGATPAAVVAMVEGMGADAVGANCSFGPAATLPVIKEILANTSLPVIMKPNAGMPQYTDGLTTYDVSEADFVKEIENAYEMGVSVFGGCCGTTPAYIEELSDFFGDNNICKERIIPKKTIVSSFTHAVEFGSLPVLIGERINPTGKKRFRQALAENDIDYVLNEAIAQQEKGVHILDVNVGAPGINEAEMLKRCVEAIQAVSDLPLQLDSSSPEALEGAMRIYNGKPLINSVNGKKESMEAVFPLVKKYGGTLIALTLDENGIPSEADERIAIAEKIINKAAEYGIGKEDIIFDPLTMTVSTDSRSADTTLQCIKRISSELGSKTSLGISNVSFGLPSRDILNSTFFVRALENGLSAAIVNPFSDAVTDAYYSYLALSNKDTDFGKYISYTSARVPNEGNAFSETDNDLSEAIYRGRREASKKLCSELLKQYEASYIINNYIIPALDRTGLGFEKGALFLPQLLMSAEAAAMAFDEIKKISVASENKKCCIVLATVKGDIHDIGKNIVRLLLENYGFDVIDLGKDVPADKILSAVMDFKAPLLGLSALMTTTLEAMRETVDIVKSNAPYCRIFVGGAVVTEEFACEIGADKYTKDALDSVKYAEIVYSEQ